MALKPISSSLDKKPLFQQMPEDGDKAEAWRNWALNLRKWAYSISQAEKKRRAQLKKLRQELARKNAVFKHYKKRIEDLENQVAIYEESVIVRMYRRVRCIFVKVASKQ